MSETAKICEHCGTTNSAQASFCENCGQSLAQNQPVDPADTTTSFESPEKITWKANLPLLTNKVVVRQLLFVLGLSMLCVLLFMLTLDIFEGNFTLAGAGRYLLISVIILGGLALLAALVMQFLYGNKYEYKYTVDENGVKAETTGATQKKNFIVNLLLVFSGRPGPAGAGLLAQSRQSELVKWDKVDTYTTNPDNLEIVLYRRKRAVMVIQCKPENYQTVRQRVEQALAEKPG
ncbi:MAG: zinc ribbon domain-containing protein [Anaerolineales bacterium]|nr:zinc ribbon domain-containing protein [Anaerolineales bacterium]